MLIRKSVFDILPKVQAQTIEELAQQAGLDFDVEKRSIFFEKSDGSVAKLPFHVATVRTDKEEWQGVVGKDYGVLQYMEALKFSEILVARGEAAYVSAGAPGRGEQSYVVMKMDDMFAIDPATNTNVECYFYMTTSHDGSLGLDVVPSFLCKANGTIPTMPHSYRLKFKHGKNVSQRVSSAKASLIRVQKAWSDFSKTCNMLRGVNLSDQQTRDYFEMLVSGDSTRAENIREELETTFKTSPICQFPATKGTLLGAYLAVVEYADHKKTVRKSKIRDEVTAKFHSRLEGDAARQKAESYGFALTLYKKMKGISH